MIRKLFIVGAVAALQLGFLVRANSAWAAAPVSVANDSITCNTVIGSVKIKPALRSMGGLGTTTLSLKGTLNGCKDNTNTNVKILASKFKGTLAGNTSSCGALLGTTPGAGSIMIKWKADKSSPIMETTSTLTVGTLTGTLFIPGGSFGAASYNSFSLGMTSVAGAFTGGDGGTTTTSHLVTGEDSGALNNTCDGAGIKAIALGIGTVTLK